LYPTCWVIRKRFWGIPQKKQSNAYKHESRKCVVLVIGFHATKIKKAGVKPAFLLK